MDCSMDNRGFLPDIFHDVYFPAVGPTSFYDVGSQHPKRRPDTLTERYFYARLKTAVSLCEFTESFEPSGCEVPDCFIGVGVLFLSRSNYKFSCLDRHVCGLIRIVFQFQIAPLPATNVIDPLFGIQLCTVEFVTPNQIPFRGGYIRYVGLRQEQRRKKK